MASIDNITVEDFKNLFTRDFPYLPLYQQGKAYFKGDIVYIEPNFYESLIDGNLDTPPSANWQLANDSVDNYISDSDIERAFSEARSIFDVNNFQDDATAIMYFCYVAAHYLVTDINNSQNSFIQGFIGLTQSKSVGSVSESYMVPSWVSNDPTLGLLSQTGFGRKYLLYIIPIARAKSLIFTPGRTTYG